MAIKKVRFFETKNLEVYIHYFIVECIEWEEWNNFDEVEIRIEVNKIKNKKSLADILNITENQLRYCDYIILKCS